MPEFLRSPFTFIKTIIIFAPIIIPFCTILLSAYNSDLKALCYLSGLILNTTLGWLFSKWWRFPRPGFKRKKANNRQDQQSKKEQKNETKTQEFNETKTDTGKTDTGTNIGETKNKPKIAILRQGTVIEKDNQTDLGSINCNIFGLNANWGIEKQGSTPDSHALFFAFTIVYIILCAYENESIHKMWPLVSILFLLTLGSGYFRSLMKCCRAIDLAIGYLLGAGVAFASFALVILANESNNHNLTYFSEPPGNTKCNLSSSEFKCDIVGDDSS